MEGGTGPVRPRADTDPYDGCSIGHGQLGEVLMNAVREGIGSAHGPASSSTPAPFQRPCSWPPAKAT